MRWGSKICERKISIIRKNGLLTIRHKLMEIKHARPALKWGLVWNRPPQLAMRRVLQVLTGPSLEPPPCVCVCVCIWWGFDKTIDWWIVSLSYLQIHGNLEPRGLVTIHLTLPSSWLLSHHDCLLLNILVALLESNGFNVIFVCWLCDVLNVHWEKVSCLWHCCAQ